MIECLSSLAKGRQENNHAAQHFARLALDRVIHISASVSTSASLELPRTCIRSEDPAVPSSPLSSAGTDYGGYSIMSAVKRLLRITSSKCGERPSIISRRRPIINGPVELLLPGTRPSPRLRDIRPCRSISKLNTKQSTQLRRECLIFGGLAKTLVHTAISSGPRP